MNTILTAGLLSALVLGAGAAPVLAAEGGRDPFPFSVPGEVTVAAPQGFDVGQAALPDFPAAYSFANNGEPTTEPTGREGVVQTAGSLPRNALVGTVEYAQEQSVARWFASRAGLRNVAGGSVRRPGG